MIKGAGVLTNGLPTAFQTSLTLSASPASPTLAATLSCETLPRWTGGQLSFPDHHEPEVHRMSSKTNPLPDESGDRSSSRRFI